MMSEEAMEISSLMAAAAAATKPVIATVTKPSVGVPGSSIVKKKELHMEKCLLMQEEMNIPIAMIENTDVYSEVISQNTWQNVLSESQRKHLMKFLPAFPQNDLAEKQNTLRELFNGQNFNFGNPLEQFHGKLRDGMFSPDIAKYAALYRKARVKEYRYQQQVYYTKLVKQLVFSRQRIMDQVNKTGIDEPLHLEMIKYQPPPKEKSLEIRVRRRYLKLLREIGEECGEEQISSEDEDEGQAVMLKNRKLQGKPASPTGHLEGAACRVLPTFAARMHLSNGDVPSNSQKNSLTEDDLRNMLRKHRKRRHDSEETPDLDTSGLTLLEVMSRTQPLKKSLLSRSGMQLGLKRKFKDKSDKVKRKVKLGDHESEDRVLPAGGEIPQDENAMDGLDETEEALAGLIGEGASGSSMASAPGFNQCGSFFSVVRDLICDDAEAKVSTMKLEEKVREWQETSAAAMATWYRQQPSWVDLVLPALKFLSGDVLGLTLDNFIPFVDYKERAQQWKWIGQGRDEDEQLQPLYKHWLEHKEEPSLSSSDQTSSLPPPPRQRTTHVVRPSSEEEKDIFREQEEHRFRSANRGFTYHMHGYESVVGPVKGVYANDSQMTKARDHALLVRDRPAYVTILTLVRDAAARLPNGEGTRSDICELLKDSQFLAPGVTDAQINTVVSGALDRLHYEKDPCVKYDVNRKLWIYLHRNRTEEEFERIHQAQGAAAKAKKALQKPKPAKKIKDPGQTMQAALKAVTSSTPTKPTLDLSKSTSPATSVVSEPLSAGSPCTPQQSPRAAFGSPRSAQSSPKVLLSGVPVSPSISGPRAVAAAQLAVTGPRTMTANPKSVAAMVQQLNSPKALGLAQGKPVSLTLLQAQETLKSQASLSTSSQSPVTAAAPIMTATQLGAKPMAFSLIQSTGNKTPETLPQTKVMLTSRAETVAQKLAASSQAAQQAAQIQLVTSHNRAAMANSLLTSQARPLSATIAGGTPVVAKLVQQGMTPQQVVTIGSTVAGALKPTVTQPTTTIKIQGTKTRCTTTPAGTPVTLQRAHSIDASVISRSSAALADARTTALLQRLQSVDGTEMRSVPVAADQVTMVSSNQATGKPMAQVSLGRGGKPATLLITKPGGTPGTKGGIQQIAGSVSLTGNETVAQLIQTTAMAGKQAMIGGKPFLIGGKPAMLAGKPIHISGKPVQLIGKAGLNMLQAQGGLVSALNMVSQTQGTMTTSTPTTRVISHNQASLIGQILPQGGAALLQQQTAQRLGKSASAVVPAQVSMATAAAQLQTKIVTPGQGGIMVTQLPNQGKQRGTSTASSNAPKLLTVTQAGLLGSQLFVQSTQSQGKVMGSHVFTTAGGLRPAVTVRPGTVTSQMAKSNPNIQVVKTMLSQASGKPAQTTIVLAQPGTQSIMATGLTPEQLSQAGVRPVATTGTKGKAGPVYARIITPPPNIRLATVRPGHMTSMPGVSVLQAMGQLPADATQILTQLPMATAHQPQGDKMEEP